MSAFRDVKLTRPPPLLSWVVRRGEGFLASLRLNDQDQLMAAPRLRKVGTRKEFDNLLDDFHTQGYEIVSEGESSTLVRRKSWGTGSGHLVCFLLTVWWTFGVGNLVYALVSHYNAEQVMIKIVDQRD
jgi:hypothetical protein